MSLINDALKKAQKQRDIPVGTPPPGLPPQTPLAPASSPAPSRGNNVTLLVAAAAVLVSASVAATVYFLRTPAPREVAVAPARGVPAPVPAAVTPPAATVPAPAPAATVASTQGSAPTPKGIPSATTGSLTTAPTSTPAGPAPATPGATVPSANIATPSPATIPTTPASAAAIVAAPPAAVVEPAPRPETPPPLKATYRIQGMIDKFRISGIRLSDTDSKVILNDHLFRTNELVEPSLGLRLTKIETHLLTFTDAEGNVYLKHF